MKILILKFHKTLNGLRSGPNYWINMHKRQSQATTSLVTQSGDNKDSLLEKSNPIQQNFSHSLIKNKAARSLLNALISIADMFSNSIQKTAHVKISDPSATKVKNKGDATLDPSPGMDWVLGICHQEWIFFMILGWETVIIKQ